MSAGSTAGETAHVTFWLLYHAEFGQRICIVGGVPALGAWQHRDAPEMTWGEGHRWSVTVDVPVGTLVEYKYLVLQPDGYTALQWQEGNNAVLAIMVRSSLSSCCTQRSLSVKSDRGRSGWPHRLSQDCRRTDLCLGSMSVAAHAVQAEDKRVEVFDNWYDPASSAVIANSGPKETRSDRLTAWSDQLNSTVGKLRGELRSTRMEVFENEEGMKQALADAKAAREELEQHRRVRTSRCSSVHCCSCSACGLEISNQSRHCVALS
jgi:Starch binding domain